MFYEFLFVSTLVLIPQWYGLTCYEVFRRQIYRPEWFLLFLLRTNPVVRVPGLVFALLCLISKVLGLVEQERLFSAFQLLGRRPKRAINLDWLWIRFPNVNFFTARKRSLGQGNIFRSVCQEFCPQGGSASVHAGIPPPPGPGTNRDQAHPHHQAPPPPSRHPQEQAHPPGTEHAGRYSQRAGGTHPTGIIVIISTD